MGVTRVSNEFNGHRLRVQRLDIDTHQQAIAFMRRDCPVCRSEGFNSMSRIELTLGAQRVIATLDVVGGEWLAPDTVGVSEAAWRLLGARDGDTVMVNHPPPLESLALVRAKIYGHALQRGDMRSIMHDIARGRYSDVQLAAFVTACAGDRLTIDEIGYLTEAMVAVGERIDWGRRQVLDKHCVGGLPGNRTTPIVVAIVAANGLCIPKTSSRAITSPAGTADTMETLAPVALALADMRRVVEQEGGCIVWGGSVNLSPTDDMLVRVERALDIDGEGQLVASVLSKKLAAGATHVLVDIPVGETAKVRNQAAAEQLGATLVAVGARLGLAVVPHLSDGSRPIGRGVGPALEAVDVLDVLRNRGDAPVDLRDRALDLAGHLLETGGAAGSGDGRRLAELTLQSGAAWRKFEAICAAQGGMREPPAAPCQHPVISRCSGVVRSVDNRVLARLAKLAGAPAAPAAGLRLAVNVGDRVARGDELFTLHAQTPGELAYALEYYHQHSGLFAVGEV
jgi:thymidine phosphorylase